MVTGVINILQTQTYVEEGRSVVADRDKIYAVRATSHQSHAAAHTLHAAAPAAPH
jgi:hypothetical protein